MSLSSVKNVNAGLVAAGLPRADAIKARAAQNLPPYYTSLCKTPPPAHPVGAMSSLRSLPAHFCSLSCSSSPRHLCSTTHAQMLTTVEIIDEDGTARSALPPPSAPAPDTGPEKPSSAPFSLKPLTIALLGGGVGGCLLLCGGMMGYHVCVRRPRQRRLVRFQYIQEVDFQIQGPAGAKLELLASPSTHCSTDGTRMADETRTECRGANGHVVGLEGACWWGTEEEQQRGPVDAAGGGGGASGAGGERKGPARGGPDATRSSDGGETPTSVHQRVVGNCSNEEPQIEIMV